MELAVIGNSYFITGFRLSGIRKIYDTEEILIEDAIKKVIEDENIGILIMNDSDYKILPEFFKKIINDSKNMTLITLGNTNGNSTNLRDKIKQAVGVDLWK